MITRNNNGEIVVPIVGHECTKIGIHCTDQKVGWIVSLDGDCRGLNIGCQDQRRSVNYSRRGLGETRTAIASEKCLELLFLYAHIIDT